MENITMGNATYLVKRTFVGSKNVSELIQNRIVSESLQSFPLTKEASPIYNSNGRNAGLRRNHAY